LGLRGRLRGSGRKSQVSGLWETSGPTGTLRLAIEGAPKSSCGG
jgi:hypothetical protein